MTKKIWKIFDIGEIRVNIFDLNERSQMSFENTIKTGINLSVIGQLKISREVIQLT